MIITLKQLKDLRACHEQVYLFEKTFGESVEVTMELCLKHASDFDFGWFVSKGFRKNQRAAYDMAMVEARAVYQAAIAEAMVVYEATIAEAFYNASQS